jgi:tripartite-type tricarboxylate transporter receptor subunit TctC
VKQPTTKFFAAMLALALALSCAEALAQAWPSRPVTLIVPQAPGGANDRAARLVAQKLEEAWHQSVLVDFKPGGGVVVGTQYVAHSAPDGYTIGIVTSAFATNPSLRKDLPYDTMKDFAAVARLGYYVMGVVAYPGLPANDMKELIALAKQHPGELEFGSNGIGTAAHLGGELLKSMAGIDMLHVPYNGGAPLYRDMLAGRVRTAFVIMGSAMPHVKAGKMKLLALTNPKRSELYPDTPVVAETVPGYSMTTWIGFVVPAGTPADVVQKVSADVVQIAGMPEMREKFAVLGLEAAPLSAPEFGRFIGEEIARIHAIVEQSGIKLK